MYIRINLRKPQKQIHVANENRGIEYMNMSKVTNVLDYLIVWEFVARKMLSDLKSSR